MPEIYVANGLKCWTEKQIKQREALIETLVAETKDILYSVNKAIQLFRVETPCMIPAEWAIGPFPYYKIDSRYVLRGESTGGTYYMQDKLNLPLPVVLYQVNKSFRDEASEAMRPSHYRYREFWQLEFQLFYPLNTKADYHTLFVGKFPKRYGTPEETETPPYASRTTDLILNGVEVASLSTRKDYKVPVFEISFGLDRLVQILGA